MHAGGCARCWVQTASTVAIHITASGYEEEVVGAVGAYDGGGCTTQCVRVSAVKCRTRTHADGCRFLFFANHLKSAFVIWYYAELLEVNNFYKLVC